MCEVKILLLILRTVPKVWAKTGLNYKATFGCFALMVSYKNKIGAVRDPPHTGYGLFSYTLGSGTAARVSTISPRELCPQGPHLHP